MILPNAHLAFIDDRKLSEYCLSETHPLGKHKAKVFKRYLGLSTENVTDLRKLILSEILEREAKVSKINEYGVLYVVDMNLENPPFTASVRTVWMVKNEEDFPRLITCFVNK